MSNGLFFTGVVLKNNRDLLKEEAARQQLAIQQEQLEIQKQDAAERRKENRRKNAPKYKDFGKTNIGGFSPAARNNINSYINAVGDNPEDYELKAKLENQVSSDLALLSKIHSDYEAKMQELAKGGEALNQANYVVGNDGMYEFERRYNEAVRLVNSGEMSAEKATQMYYNNDNQSLYKVTREESLGAGIVDSYKGEGGGDYRFINEETGKSFLGWSNEAKNAIYEKYKDSLSHSPEKGFESPQGQRTYFNSRFDGVNAQVLFFRESEGKLTVDEQSNILSQLNPESEDYNIDLANKYIDFLARKDSDRFMTSRGVEAQTSGDKFKNLQPVEKWEELMGSNELTNQSYGKHGKMLEEFKISQEVKDLTLSDSMIDTLEVSDRDPSINTERARELIRLTKDKGEIDLKLNQVMINKDKNNMFAIFNVTIPEYIATDREGPANLEIAVPLKQIDAQLYGKTTARWFKSFENRSVYGTGSEPKGKGGVGAPRPS